MTKRVFFTSDTHFGHEGIIRYCKRPFGSVAEMDDMLVANWNAVVQPDDEVWHLGDFAHGADAKHIRRVFSRLHGRKYLVAGNHDRQATLDLPWSQRVSQIAETTVDGQRIVMCHYGLRVWRGMRRGAIHLYGHSHGSLPGSSRSLDVGVDEWSYAPVRLDRILKRMATLPEPADMEGSDED